MISSNLSSVSVELMVIGAMRVDTGMYTCSVSNIIGSVTRSITITVQCKFVIHIHAKCLCTYIYNYHKSKIPLSLITIVLLIK